MHFRAELHGVPIVPISLIRAPLDASPVSLADVRAHGDLLGSVQGFQHVLSGGFARGITRTQTIVPADRRTEFSATRDKDLIVFVTWSPQIRLKGALLLRIYDEANRLTVDSKPGKLDVRPGNSLLSNWKLAVPSKPGMYRADVMVEGVPIWRGFVRITE